MVDVHVDSAGWSRIKVRCLLKGCKGAVHGNSTSAHVSRERTHRLGDVERINILPVFQILFCEG